MNWKPDVIESLKGFSAFFDDFLLVAAKPLAILGFAMGTVDIFTRGGIATAWWFNVPWAIVQATTIDGLFFAVWYRIFETKWKWVEAGTNLLLVFIGLVLGLVAMITNGILSLQQLRGIPDSLQAMSWLGIDPTTFTIGRAVLVVFVSVMVAFVYHQRADVVPAVQGGRTVVPGPTLLAEQWNTDWNSLPTLWSFGGTDEEQWVEYSGTNGNMVRTALVPVEQPVLIPEHAEQTDQDKLRALFQQAKDTNAPINLVEVGRKSGIAYQRVRKLAPTIKRELGM